MIDRTEADAPADRRDAQRHVEDAECVVDDVAPRDRGRSGTVSAACAESTASRIRV